MTAVGHVVVLYFVVHVFLVPTCPKLVVLVSSTVAAILYVVAAVPMISKKFSSGMVLVAVLCAVYTSSVAVVKLQRRLVH